MIDPATKPRETRRGAGSLALQKLFFVCFFLLFVTSWRTHLHAHSGPPFPIVSDHAVNGYKVSVWTDPDVTDDVTKAGRFWVTVSPAARSVVVAVEPLDRKGETRTETAQPVNGDTQRYFTALRLDHEGRFDVRVRIDGSAGRADVGAYVDATYDLRPRPALMILFVLPFLLIGFVWGKLLIKRRSSKRVRISSNTAS